MDEIDDKIVSDLMAETDMTEAEAREYIASDKAMYEEKIADGTITRDMSASDISRILGPIGDGIARYVTAVEQRKTLQTFMPNLTLIVMAGLAVLALRKKAT